MENAGVPLPKHVALGQILSAKESSLWAEVEGTVTFLHQEQTKGLNLELNSRNGAMHVRIADGSGSLSDLLLHSEVRVTGICRSTYELDGQTTAGAMWSPNLEQIKILNVAPELWATHPLTDIKDLVRDGAKANESVVHVSGQLLSAGRGRQW